MRILALIVALACLGGCSSAAARARNAADAAAYTAELDACLAKAKSYPEYKTCADEVDFRHAVEKAQTSKDGSQ